MQRFTGKSSKEEALRFAREAGLALGTVDPSKRIRALSPGPDWEDRFKEQLQGRGDDGRASEMLFGKTRQP
jgi:hypothetical protein